MIHFSTMVTLILLRLLTLKYKSNKQPLQVCCCELKLVKTHNTLRGRTSLGRGHGNSCLGKSLVHEGTTAIPTTVEGHQGKFKSSKGASRQTILSFDKLRLLRLDKTEGAGLVCPLLWEWYKTVFSSKDLANDK